MSQASAAVTATYIHGTERDEQERLAALNRMTNQAFVEFLRVEPDMSILEVGSGLGILAQQVAAAAPGVMVTGLEYSSAQIAAAGNPPGVTFVHGDAHRMPFPDNSFDLVYARYLLEHVADPMQVIREMRRVLRPGGRVAVQENDISLIRVDPPCGNFEQVWSAFAVLQRQLNGDALIGRRLFRLFKDAAFGGVELSVQPEVHWYGSEDFLPWIHNLIGNIEGGRDRLLKHGLCGADRIEGAIAELKALMCNERASSVFIWNRATGIKDASCSHSTAH